MRLAPVLVLVAACQNSVVTGPRLAVLVIFDQMRAVEIDKFAPFFDGGFGGLEGRGAARYDARYTYADTETAPGHATISTGANPRTHGIVSNYWFEPSGDRIYCADDDTAPVLGSHKKHGASARWLQAQTFADTLKLESNGRAHVVTISLKDRAAILTGGRSADLALWYDTEQCAFTTSRAYAAELPGWIRWMATELPAKSMATGTWSPLPIPRELEALAGADASVNEAAEVVWKDRFPHDLASLPTTKDKCIAYKSSPQAIDDLFAMARVAVEARDLALGDDAVPDLLVVSVSVTDYVSHGYGPQSLEVLDILRRSDLALRNFVGVLDARLGRGGYVIAVASDHGSTPQPELGKSLGLDAGRIDVPGLRKRIEDTVEHVVSKGGTPPPTIAVAPPKAAEGGPHMIAKDVGGAPVFKWLKGLAPPHVYLDLAGLDPARRAQALEATRRAIATHEGIAEAYIVEDGVVRGNDRYVRMYQELVYPGRNGVIMIRPKARWTYAFDAETVGTDHGSPYNYDATVPFIVSGPGVRRGRYAQPCDVRDIAPTLAFLLHTPAPDHCEGRPVSAVGADRQ